VTDIDGGERKVADLAGWRESSAFTDLERAALEYAERMTYTGQKVDDALFGRLKKHFGETQIVELTAAIAFENFRSKFNPALGVESQGFCVLPKR
jgi:alkylhydroperoxidase family enzyme